MIIILLLHLHLFYNINSISKLYRIRIIVTSKQITSVINFVKEIF